MRQIAYLLLLLTFALTMPALAQSSGPVIHPDPLVFEVGEGQVETVRITLENAVDVYGIDLKMSFDPSVVEVVDSDPSKEGVQMIPGSFPQPDFVVINTADNEAGTLRYVTTQVNPTPPANGNGVVLEIQFRGKVLGKQSALIVESVVTADRTGVKQTLEKQEGQIPVVKPKPPTPTATLENPQVTATQKTPRPHKATKTPKAENVASPTPTLIAADIPSKVPTILTWVAIGGGVGAAALLIAAGFIYFKRPPKI